MRLGNLRDPDYTSLVLCRVSDPFCLDDFQSCQSFRALLLLVLVRLVPNQALDLVDAILEALQEYPIEKPLARHWPDRAEPRGKQLCADGITGSSPLLLVYFPALTVHADRGVCAARRHRIR